MNTALWWIRRDLRLEDNPALQSAKEHAERVIPVFILDPHLIHTGSARRVQFLVNGLHALNQRLMNRGSRLVVRQGDPAGELDKLARESGAGAVFAEEDFSPFSRRRDQEAGKAINLRLCSGLTVLHPLAVARTAGQPYRVFSHYMRAWKERMTWAEPEPGRGGLGKVPEGLESFPLPAFEELEMFRAGEEEAARRLNHFCEEGIFRYADSRNLPGEAGTSELSPYLRFGMISARRAVLAAHTALLHAVTGEQRSGCESWINELIWRDFYQMILYFHPNVLREAHQEKYRKIDWRQDAAGLEAWKAGRTGVPVVDAAMRQLSATGWMHNRARMISASFLVKDLLVNWQDGEQWFMKQLVDGDPASNNGGWQWSAGVGTDAAPYFRILNPVTQGKRHDPQGVYVRRWVEELRKVPDAYIHTPWEMPLDVQAASSCRVGMDYPYPIVDHRSARVRVMEAFRRVS